MGMVVRSNIMALNANRQLGMNNSAVSKSLEKLSSGFKINRAGDDASGLAISEKMKAQIKGLETASANSQDGISLVQTAEGALTEVHDMLNRMVELSEKAANGTMENAVDENGNPIEGTYGNAGTDRNAIQDEMDALATEIDRIAKSTNFNGIKLLDGSLGGAIVNQKPVGNAKPPENDTPSTTPSDGVTLGNVELGGVGKKASFEIDIALESGKTYNIGGKYFTFAGDAPAKAAAEGDGTPPADDGSKEKPFTVTMTGKTKDVIMKEVAAKFEGKFVTIGDKEFGVGAANGKLTFTAKEEGVINDNGKALTKEAFETLIKETIKVEADTDTPTEPVVEPFFKAVAAAGKDGTNGTVTVTFDPANIKDGSQIEIGGTKYTFALKGGKVVTSGEGVIDLTGSADNIPTGKEIADKVAAVLNADTAANAVKTKYEVAVDSSNNLTFTEKTAGAQTEADLNDLVQEVPAAESNYGVATADMLSPVGMRATPTSLEITNSAIGSGNGSPKYQPVAGSGKFFTIADITTTTDLKLAYKDATGADRTIDLSSCAFTNGAAEDAKAIATAIEKGCNGALSVDVEDTKLTIRVAADNTYGGSISFSGTGAPTGTNNDLTAVDKAYSSLDFNGVQAGNKFSINNTTFEFVDEGDNVTDLSATKIEVVKNVGDGAVDMNKTLANITAAMDTIGITAEPKEVDSTILVFTEKAGASESPDAINPGDSVESGKAVKLDLSEVKKAAEGGNLKSGDIITIGNYALTAQNASGASTAAAQTVNFTIGKDFDESMKNAVEAFNKASDGKAGTLAYDAASASFTLSGVDTVPTMAAKVNGKDVTINATLVDAPKDKAENTYGVTELTMTQQPKAGGTVTVGGKVFEFVKKTGDKLNNENATEVVIGSDAKATLDALSKAINADADLKSKVEASIDPNNPNKLILKNITDSTADETADDYAPEVTTDGLGGLTLQIGDTYDTFNRMDVSIGHMDMNSLFTTTGDVNDPVLQKLNDGTMSLDISTQENAGKALTAIRKAINTVSTQRAKLGAIQNRLEHTINNLDVAAENMNAANSRIRDTDMAKQMMDYTKMNVLTQAAQAMLAQANQQPQSVLQLLQ